MKKYRFENDIHFLFQIKRVQKGVKNTRGVTFDDFKNFYNVLFGGSDLERAMFFLDTEKNGINRYVNLDFLDNVVFYITDNIFQNGHINHISF